MIDCSYSIARLARQIVTWGAFSLVPALSAASGPPPVTVQGVVETINDVLREPFRKTIGGSTTATGIFPFSAGFIKHDIPVGAFTGGIVRAPRRGSRFRD